MKNIDLKYICKSIGDLSGVPIRIFQEGNMVFFHSFSNLPQDPAVLYLDALAEIREHVGYLITNDFYNYGVVNCEAVKIVIGPTRQVIGSDQELRELAFRLGITGETANTFLSGMKSIVQMPLESVLQVLCTINYILNDEKLQLRDIQIHEQEQEQLRFSMEISRAREIPTPRALTEPAHNTLSIENVLMEIISRGDTAMLKEWISGAPAIRGGTLAAEQLRQRKNLFVVTATLASRAAIRGGMDPEDALSLSDRYIQSCEYLASPERITNLQYHMILEYTERVERVRHGRTPTPLALKTANFIQHHLSEPITAQDVADELHLNRSYLTRWIKAETGETLTDFILKEKTEEAKRLLRYTDKSSAVIAAYLGFSSQSHFSRVFKKYAGVNPGEYREKGRNQILM